MEPTFRCIKLFANNASVEYRTIAEAESMELPVGKLAMTVDCTGNFGYYRIHIRRRKPGIFQRQNFPYNDCDHLRSRLGSYATYTRRINDGRAYWYEEVLIIKYADSELTQPVDILHDDLVVRRFKRIWTNELATWVRSFVV